MNKNQMVGRAIALGAAIFYGFNTTLSRLAYDTGTTPLSLTIIRFVMAAALVALIVLALRKSWKIEVKPIVFAVCIFGNFATSIGTLWIMIASVAFSLLVLPFGFELVPPRESMGWVYLVMITLATVTAFVLALQAISRIGGAIFALLLNFEPVVILLLAWIVIGEQLSPELVSGMALIVFALFLSHCKVPRIASKTAQAPSD